MILRRWRSLDLVLIFQSRLPLALASGRAAAVPPAHPGEAPA